MRIASLIIALALLDGCSGNSTVPTSEENRQLDEAAEMLNEAPANLDAVDDGGLGRAHEASNAGP